MLRLIKVTLRVHMGNLIFLLCAAGTLIYSIISGRKCSEDAGLEFYYHFDNRLMTVVLISAAAVTVFGMCTDFSDRTIHGKFTAGYSKIQFYLAELAAAVIDSIVFFLLAYVPYAAIGYENFFSRFSTDYLIREFLIIFASVIVTALLLVFICGLMRNRALALIVCGLALFGLVVAHNECDRKLSPPEQSIAISGEEVWDEELNRWVDVYHNQWIEQNRFYVGEPARSVLLFLYRINPMSSYYTARDPFSTSAEDFSLEEVRERCEKAYTNNDRYNTDVDFLYDRRVNNNYYPLWSGGFALLLNAAGILIFKKRNIN